MRLHEYEAADIFEKAGISVTNRCLVSTPTEAIKAAEEIGYPVVVKAQVLVGGRGKAGGIKTAYTAKELNAIVKALLESEIKGLPVNNLLISKKVTIVQELYLGITIDSYRGKPVIVVSTKGGINIEETAAAAPENVTTLHMEPGEVLYPYQARQLLEQAGLTNRGFIFCADTLVRLYRVFIETNAIIAEINPLTVGPDERVTAVDAVLEIDDSAVFRLKETLDPISDRMSNPLEMRGKKIGVTYVDLDGDIGLIASGAGLGMASMDIIGERLKPANFLETGGGITSELMYQCMELLFMKKGIRALLINIYGGINPIHEGAKGVVQYIQDHNVKLPIVAKALGNRQEETWEIFRSGGIHVVTDTATEKAVDKLYEVVNSRQESASNTPVKTEKMEK